MTEKILVATDAGAAADLAVQTAAELAKAEDAELLVVFVKPPVDAREVFAPGRMPDADAYLAAIAGRFSDVKTRTRSETGDPAETICEVAEEEGAGVIVIGNRGTHGKRRWFLGSVPNAVVQHAPCSVYIVDTRSAQ
ncbi:MAG: universal stress protein [Actinobacteria bacterium]|nr:universal stress protein [Actinomycetota bacterium]